MAVRSITTRLALDGETQFKQAMTSINGALRNLKSEIALSEAQFKGQANTVAALTAKNKLLSEQIDQQKEKIKTLNDIVKRSTEIYGEESNITDRYRQQLNRAKAELIGLDRELVENGKYLKEARDSADGTAKSIDGFGNATKQAGDSVSTLASALQAAGVAMALKEIADAIHACVDASMDFETAMANVNKVAKLSDEELAGMGDAIKELSTEMPATTGEIAQVVEAAARLGIAKEDLLSFSEVMVDLGNVSDLTSDQAATALARFANITGTAAEDYERLGSTIVALGNNFATSESEITNMASRLAAAGELAGLTEAQIMGLAAAMSSVGIEAEAGGTAMTQTLTAMEKAVTSGGDKLEDFAQIAGMSSEEFAKAWREDPITAIQEFITGLGQLDSQGESATQILEELGLSGIRQSNMLKSLALASETLTGALAAADQAWRENNELAETAAAKYDTTEAKMQMAANAANNLKIAVGDALAPALADISEAGTAAFGWIEVVIRDNPWLVQGITAVVTVLGLLTAGLTAYNVIAPIAASATGALATALHLIPFVGVAAAIAAVIAGLNSFVKWLGRAKDEVEAFDGAAESLAVSTGAAGEVAEQLAGMLAEMDPAARAAAVGMEGAADSASGLTSSMEELEEATLYLSGAADTLSKALKEQSEEGSLSYKTTQDLIEAGYGAALAIDEESGALQLNRELYVQITQAKIDEQIATLEAAAASNRAAIAAQDEAMAVYRGAEAYYRAAEAKRELEGQQTSYSAQIAALNALKNSIGSVTGETTRAARASRSAGKQAKTQAQQDLETYKQLKAELDHLKATDLVDEAEYYRKMAEYRDAYLTDDANVSEYRKVTEQIYKYDKSLADREAQLWADQTNNLVDQLEERIDAVSDQQDKMESRLSGYGDLFNTEDDRLTLSSLQDQISAIEAYGDALDQLRNRGISGGLMDEVMGMDVDSATQYARQLLAMSDQQWEEYNALWEEKQETAARIAEEFFKEQMDALENEYNAKLGDALGNLTDTSFQAGVNTGQELIDGLASMETALYAQAQAMADRVSDILSGAGRIPSNSELAALFSTDRIREQFYGVTPQQMQDVGVGMVNAMNTTGGGSPRSVTLKVNLNSRTIAEETIDDIRTVGRERPETLDDK